MIVTLTGPMASGKTTIAGKLIEEINQSVRIPSVTTRQPLVKNTVPGEYQHISRVEFDVLKNQGSFEWSIQYGGEWYGMLKESLIKAISDPNRIWVMVLMLKAVTHMRNFLKAHDALEQHKPFFILVPDDERLIRAKKRDGNNVISEAKEINWSAWANETGTPFIRVENREGELERSVAEIRAVIKD